MFNKTP